MKLGILGGSFNPVHLGHLYLADKVFTALNLDRIVFVPAYCSPFKQNAKDPGCTAEDRIDMLASAIAGESRYAIDDCEIKRGGVSYTVDTLGEIIERYQPAGKPYLIIGDDIIADFHKWRDSDRILQTADIVIAKRIGSTASASFPHTLINNDAMEISSQFIRASIPGNGGWRSLVPAGVKVIIEDRNLYGCGQAEPDEDCSAANILRIEAAVRQNISVERFLHSRSTALQASDMCRRFGLNPAAGYLAGIAHDYAKQTDNKQLMKIVKSAGLPISQLEKDKPNLLHGKAGAILLRDRLYIHNKDVLEAVSLHTSGSDKMGPLAKIIYIADKTESTRIIDPALRKLCSTGSREADLEKILFAVVEKTVVKLQSRKLDLSEDTLLLLKRMKERNN